MFTEMLLLHNNFLGSTITHLYDVKATLRLIDTLAINGIALNNRRLLCGCCRFDSRWISQSNDISKALPYFSIAICINRNCRHMKSGISEIGRHENCNTLIETASNKVIYGCSASTIPDGITTIGNRNARFPIVVTLLDILIEVMPHR